MADEQYANDAETTLAAAITTVGQTTIQVSSAVRFPPAAQYRIRIDDELLLVTAGAGSTTWTVSRGAEGTTAATHDNGSRVVHILTAGALLNIPHFSNTANPHAVTAAQAGALALANNLSDLENAATARGNLGLGTMAVQNANAVAITGGTATGMSVDGVDVGAFKTAYDSHTHSHAALAGVTSDQHHAQLHAATHHVGAGDELSHDALAGYVAAEHVSLPSTIAAVLSDHSKAAHDALGLSHDSLSDVSADDHHAQLHAASHHLGAGDELNHDNLAGFVAAEHVSLPNTIAAVLSDHDKAAHDALGLSHDSLVDVSADDHHNEAHVADSTGPHTAAGLTIGYVLRASAVAAFAWAQLQHSDLGSVTSDLHHAQLHAASHHVGGGDLVNHDSLTGFVAAEHVSLPNTIVAVLSDHTKAAHDALGLSHDSLSNVSVDDHHAQAHNVVGGDHTLTSAKWKLVGATETDTLGLLTPSADVSAGAEAILKSTAAGDLALHNLKATGGLNVGTRTGATVGEGFFSGKVYVRETDQIGQLLAYEYREVLAADIGGSVVFGSSYATGGAMTSGVAIKGLKLNDTHGNYSYYLSLWTRKTGSAMAERMRIDEEGNVGIGTKSPQTRLNVVAPGTDIVPLYIESSDYFQNVGGKIALEFRTLDTRTTSTRNARIGMTNEEVWTQYPALYFSLSNIERMRITNAGNVGINRVSPQGRLHGYDTISGFLHWEYDGVDGTARTVIPNGAGDVVYGLFFLSSVRASDGNTGPQAGTSHGVIHPLGQGLPNSVKIYSRAGVDDLHLIANADGSVVVQRTAGAVTYKVSLWLLWI